ncbi:MAG TPA: hypothetical protein VKW78_19755 [Terriglobales bacterium]|nr:hypothetical protein [Terriglobales bacterium]
MTNQMQFEDLAVQSIESFKHSLYQNLLFYPILFSSRLAAQLVFFR